MMVDYDLKLFVSKQNRKHFENIGLTQIEEYGYFNFAPEWYVGTQEYCENEDITQSELEAFTEKRLRFDTLIESVFHDGCVFLYSNKKSADDELWDVFPPEGMGWWDSLLKLEEKMDSLEVPYLQFGNDDLNGWGLTRYKVDPKHKSLIDECLELGEV